MDTDKELMLDVGQANEIKMAARRAGATNADLKKLSEGDMFAKILPVIRGLAQVVMVKHLINCDADTFIPNGWSVRKGDQLSNVVRGMMEWNPAGVKLYLSKNQKGDKYVGGHDLRKELEDKPVLNANVLDYLLAHPKLIPESWKGKAVFFWGTIYHIADGGPYVRYFRWDGDGWTWGGSWLGDDWDGGGPAALLASE